MDIKSINPYNSEVIQSYTSHTKPEIETALENSLKAFQAWKKTSFEERSKRMANVAENLRKNRTRYAETITLEMGKPISESVAEVDKCAWACDFYSENAESMLADELIETDASESFISYDPLGPVLAVMPWNYPLWQVFRFAAPTLMAGNSAILKHASNVTGCAKLIEKVFKSAGFPEHLFQALVIHHNAVEDIIAHDNIKAVTLTGSEKAGRSVASIAGRNIKKTVLELGGSNPFIIWEDADMKMAAEVGVNARMMNCGQSCIAAKRFIVVGDAWDEYLSLFVEKCRNLRQGDPMDDSTQIGPLARKDLAETLHQQVRDTIDQGAELLLGGNHDGARYEPTVLANVTPGMTAFDEETFGPVASFTRAHSEEEAFGIASQSRFGLGVTVCTRDTDRALRSVGEIEDGAYYINKGVASDPRLPFGGTKNSGYGRELSREGILEFVNTKTVYVR